MKGQLIKKVYNYVFECNYEEGDCKYKNPENLFSCLGCKYAKTLELKQTPPEIINQKQY